MLESIQNLVSFKYYDLIFKIFTLVALIILFYIIKNFFVKFVIKRFEILIIKYLDLDNQEASTKFDKHIKLLLILILTFLYNNLFIFNENFSLLVYKVLLSLTTILVFWLLLPIIEYSKVLNFIDNRFSLALTNWIKNGLKYILILLGLGAVLELWGIKIGPIIAGLGLLGVAVALGAQDLFKNLISGMIIISENKFKINDVIEVPGFGLGTVEKIGFRSTTVRAFDSSPLFIPNNIVVDQAISNFTDRRFRRINWTIGLEYSTKVENLQNIRDSIEDYIKNKSELFLVNNEYSCHVRLEKFNDSSIDLLIICFANTNLWGDYLKIKEQLLLEIKKIVEIKNKSNFAFPSRTLYLESNNPLK